VKKLDVVGALLAIQRN